MENKPTVTPPNIEIIIQDLWDVCDIYWNFHATCDRWWTVTGYCPHGSFSAVSDNPFDPSTAYVEIYNLASTHPYHTTTEVL